MKNCEDCHSIGWLYSSGGGVRCWVCGGTGQLSDDNSPCGERKPRPRYGVGQVLEELGIPIPTEKDGYSFPS